jgi:hypothetical protein
MYGTLCIAIYTTLTTCSIFIRLFFINTLYNFKNSHSLRFVSLYIVLSLSNPFRSQYSLYSLDTFDAGRFSMVATCTVVLHSENNL